MVCYRRRKALITLGDYVQLGLGRAVRPCSYTRSTVFSGGRNPSASGPPGVGPASRRRSLVLRGQRPACTRLQGRCRAGNRGHPVRRGSEQRPPGHLSLAGLRGGGSERDTPHRNAGQSRASVSALISYVSIPARVLHYARSVRGRLASLGSTGGSDGCRISARSISNRLDRTLAEFTPLHRRQLRATQ